MARARKVIITCAVTGSIHPPSMSPHLPITAEEIADAAIGAAEVGAAVVHLHARDPRDGRPDQSPEAFGPPGSLDQRRGGPEAAFGFSSDVAVGAWLPLTCPPLQ